MLVKEDPKKDSEEARYSIKKPRVSFTYGQEEKEELDALIRLLRYVGKSQARPTKGRMLHGTYGFIYWPDVALIRDAPNRYQALTTSVSPVEDTLLFDIRKVCPLQWTHPAIYPIWETVYQHQEPVPSTLHPLIQKTRPILQNLYACHNAPLAKRLFKKMGIENTSSLTDDKAILTLVYHIFHKEAAAVRTLERIKVLLGPLNIQSRAIKHNLLLLYLQKHAEAEKRKQHPDYPEQTQPLTPYEERARYAPLENPDFSKIIVFRRVTVDATSLLRTRPWLLPPLDKIEPALYDVPHLLQLLWHAWKAAYFPESAREALGLEFVRTGHLCINWRVFRQSSQWPQDIQANPSRHLNMRRFKGIDHYTPDAIVERIEKTDALFKPFRRGLVPRKFTLSETDMKQPYHLYINPGQSRYVRLCNETQSINYGQEAEVNTDASTFDPCTLIDPLILAHCEKYFYGGHYLSKEHRKLCVNVLPTAPRLTSEFIPTRTSRYFCIRFQPAAYLSKEEVKYLWFDVHHTEPVYAIRRQETLYFTRPGHLKQAKQAPNGLGEVETWFKAMDLMQLQDDFYKTEGGKLGAFQPNKSQFYKQMDQHLKAQYVYEHFNKLRWETLSIYKKRQYTKLYNAHWSQENEGHPATQRYGLLCQQLKEEGFRLEDAFKRVYVTLPGAQEPELLQFLTPRAIEIIEKLAKESFSESGDTTSAYYTPGCGAAPYVLAWVRFCKAMSQRREYTLGDSFFEGSSSPKRIAEAADIRQRYHFYQAYLPDHLCNDGDVYEPPSYIQVNKTNNKTIKRSWWPQEDYILFMNYTYHHSGCKSNTSKDTWCALLDMLPDRNKAACMNRIRLVNNMLKKCVLTSHYDKIHVGKAFPANSRLGVPKEEAVLRVIYLYGFAKYLKHKGEKVHLARRGFQQIMRASHNYLRKLGLPSMYTNYKFFEQFDV